MLGEWTFVFFQCIDNGRVLFPAIVRCYKKRQIIAKNVNDTIISFLRNKAHESHVICYFTGFLLYIILLHYQVLHYQQDWNLQTCIFITRTKNKPHKSKSILFVRRLAFPLFSFLFCSTFFYYVILYVRTFVPLYLCNFMHSGCLSLFLFFRLFRLILSQKMMTHNTE